MSRGVGATDVSSTKQHVKSKGNNSRSHDGQHSHIHFLVSFTSQSTVESVTLLCFSASQISKQCVKDSNGSEEVVLVIVLFANIFMCTV